MRQHRERQKYRPLRTNWHTRKICCGLKTKQRRSLGDGRHYVVDRPETTNDRTRRRIVVYNSTAALSPRKSILCIMYIMHKLIREKEENIFQMMVTVLS